MATKLFKRSPAPDVFDKVADEQNACDVEIDHAAADPGMTMDSGTDHDTDDGASTDTADGAPGEAAPSRRLRRAALGVCGAILVAALGATAFLGWQYKQHVEIANASREALETARSYAVTVTSMDSRGVDDNFNKVLDGATGEFKDMYSQSAGQLRQVLVDNKAMSRGVVVDSAVKSATRDKVEVLLFIDQSITNTANPEPRLDRSRVDMTLEHVAGRWLASSLELK